MRQSLHDDHRDFSAGVARPSRGLCLEAVAPVIEPTLLDLIDKLATAVTEHAAVTDKAVRMLAGQIDEVWADNAALRDELHSSNAALANRIEGIVRL